MKKPITVDELVVKYNSLSLKDKVLFGSDLVVPIEDLENLCKVVECSVSLNSKQSLEAIKFLKFLRDNQSKFDPVEFRFMIASMSATVQSLIVEEKALELEFNKFVLR